MAGHDIAEYWQHKAAAYDPEDNPYNVWEALLLIAEDTPANFREALQAAAAAVGARFCNHAHAPSPLADIRNLVERQVAAQQHAGLCGKYHAQHIANIDLAVIEERARGVEISTKRVRNQVCPVHAAYACIRLLACALAHVLRSSTVDIHEV